MELLGGALSLALGLRWPPGAAQGRVRLATAVRCVRPLTARSHCARLGELVLVNITVRAFRTSRSSTSSLWQSLRDVVCATR